jgi:hypothetical protein
MRRQHEDPEAAAIAAALAGVTAGTGAPAVPAFTTSGNGVMETGEFVLWRDANFTGPLYDEFNHRSNYNGLTYVGTNISIDNSASSAANYDATIGVQAVAAIHRGTGHRLGLARTLSLLGALAEPDTRAAHARAASPLFAEMGAAPDPPPAENRARGG